GFEDPDRPWSLERIIEACGGEAIDYPAKIKCCGFPIIQAREETALGELIQPIEQAVEAGADAIVTPCPLCHLSLDAWQSKLKAATGRDFAMPILHLSPLLGVPSRGVRAVERAVDWVAQRRPDLVCLTGDLLSRPRGEKRLRSLIERLGHPYVVLGNHDIAESRDPFSRAVELEALEHGTLL